MRKRCPLKQLGHFHSYFLFIVIFVFRVFTVISETFHSFIHSFIRLFFSLFYNSSTFTINCLVFSQFLSSRRKFSTFKCRLFFLNVDHSLKCRPFLLNVDYPLLCGNDQEVRVTGVFYVTQHYFAFVGKKVVDMNHFELNRQFRDVMRHDEVITIKKHTKSNKALVFTDLGQVRSPPGKISPIIFNFELALEEPDMFFTY